jgi:uncharacterized membrane protein/nitrite reductase/ring-hydroxylating ferredoxin subunit
MRSKAHIKGHPLHPILVSFPIALFTGALLLDLLAVCTGTGSYLQAAVYAEAGGALSAVVAAVPGVIDYIYTVPPGSSAKRRAGMHALLNSTALLLFTMILLLRLKHEIGLTAIICLEGAGVLLLGIAGWMGGTLVIRNQIGVDHRYAHAGRWAEEVISTAAAEVELKEVDRLRVNQMKLLRVNDKRIVIARTENGLVAFEDRCTHRGASLADGVLICGTVQCPWHGSQFSAGTGEVKAGPAAENIRVYAIRQQGSAFWLQL